MGYCFEFVILAGEKVLPVQDFFLSLGTTNKGSVVVNMIAFVPSK